MKNMTERNRLIGRIIAEGGVIEYTAKAFGLSRQRVREIALTYCNGFFHDHELSDAFKNKMSLKDRCIFVRSLLRCTDLKDDNSECFE